MRIRWYASDGIAGIDVFDADFDAGSLEVLFD
jgi:hypothetical protein